MQWGVQRGTHSQPVPGRSPAAAAGGIEPPARLGTRAHLHAPHLRLPDLPLPVVLSPLLGVLAHLLLLLLLRRLCGRQENARREWARGSSGASAAAAAGWRQHACTATAAPGPACARDDDLPGPIVRPAYATCLLLHVLRLVQLLPASGLVGRHPCCRCWHILLLLYSSGILLRRLGLRMLPLLLLRRRHGALRGAGQCTASLKMACADCWRQLAGLGCVDAQKGHVSNFGHLSRQQRSDRRQLLATTLHTMEVRYRDRRMCSLIPSPRPSDCCRPENCNLIPGIACFWCQYEQKIAAEALIPPTRHLIATADTRQPHRPPAAALPRLTASPAGHPVSVRTRGCQCSIYERASPTARGACWGADRRLALCRLLPPAGAAPGGSAVEPGAGAAVLLSQWLRAGQPGSGRRRAAPAGQSLEGRVWLPGGRWSGRGLAGPCGVCR